MAAVGQFTVGVASGIIRKPYRKNELAEAPARLGTVCN